MMIRGSIEVARRTQVSGWIHAELGTVRDRLILAFSGDRCVGAGKVDRFRKDLLEAKLGDGYCGFDFPIILNDDEGAGSVIVKLQNSDAALIQAASRLVGPGENVTGPDGGFGVMAPATMSWMQDRGWLDQHEYDFLTMVHRVGAYERGLRPVKRQAAELAPPLKPEQAARDLLSLCVLGDIDVERSKVASISDLAGENSPLFGDGVAVVALWSQERCRIALDERSHARPASKPGAVTIAAAPGAIEYGFGPDRLLFVHRHASFAPLGVAPASGVTVFAARPRRLDAAAGARSDRAA
jgi:hypothetical protein